MGYSIAELQELLIEAKVAEAALAGLTSTSAVAEWKEWTYIVALCEHMLAELVAFHKEDITAQLATQKPHTLKWYVKKAKEFQWGVSLPIDSDEYAVVPPVDTAVLVIDQAAAEEMPTSKVRIKVATGDPLGALPGPKLAALKAYMFRVKDAGVRLEITTGDPDDLRFGVGIGYDPLVLAADGKRLDGTNDTPVKDGINAFLKALPFNGLFVKDDFIDYLRDNVEGVLIADTNVLKARYGMMTYDPIDYEYKPDAGYLLLDETFFDANVTYTAHDPLA